MGIENQYVSFLIIKRNKNGLIYNRAVLLLILALFFVVSIPSNQGSTLKMVLFVAIILLLILVGIKKYGIKKYEEIGKVTLFPGSVQVIENNELNEILIEELDALAFAFSGYENQPVFARHGHSKDGLNNFITIRNKAYRRRFEVLVTNVHKIDILNRLLDHYQSLGIKNEFRDLYSRDAKMNIIAKFFLGFGNSK